MLTRLSFHNRAGQLTLVVTALTLVSTLANARDINVGVLRPSKTLAAGVASASAGDRLLLDPGVYLDDTTSIDKALTIEGAGDGVVLKITRHLDNQKGILIGNANLTVRNLTFDGAFVLDSEGKNGAGIRMQSGNLTVENCTFQNNQDGMLVNPIAGATVTITGSTFLNNGAGDGYSHGIYVNEVAQVIVRDSTFIGTKAGHSIKSRALATTVTNTVIEDGVVGTSSYAIDLSNGGNVLIDGVKITQGPNTTNPTMIAYGAEGNLKASNSLTVANSTFINKLASSSAVAVYNFTTTVSAVLTNDTAESIATVLRGPGTGVAPAAGPILRQGAVFSSGQLGQQSYLRFYNRGAAAGTVKVALYDMAGGAALATWQSPPIAPNAALQISVATLEQAATAPFATPAFYAVAVQPTFSGSFQHVLYRPAQGTITNLSGCDNGVTNNGSSLANVHTSLLEDGFPSIVMIYNTGPAATVLTIGIFDASSGARLGTYTTSRIDAGGQAAVRVSAMEAAARIKPPSGSYHYTLKVESTFTGVLQHFVNNVQAAMITDMTTVCALGN